MADAVTGVAPIGALPPGAIKGGRPNCGAPGRKRRVGGAAGGAIAAGPTDGAGTASGGTVLLVGAAVAAAGAAGSLPIRAPGAAAGVVGAAVPVLFESVRGSPLTARRRMASRKAMSEASPSLVAGVWAIRPRQVEKRISRVVFTVI